MLTPVEETILNDLRALGELIKEDKANGGANQESSRVEIAILGAQMALKTQTLEDVSEDFYLEFAKATPPDLRFLFLSSAIMATRVLIQD